MSLILEKHLVVFEYIPASGKGAYEFPTKVYFLSSVTAFVELAHECHHHSELHTTKPEMD